MAALGHKTKKKQGICPLKEIVMEVIIANKEIILGVLWAVSEALALIPQVKANSIFQLVVNLLSKFKK